MWPFVLSALLAVASSFTQTDGKDPDLLYAGRDQLANARQAADVWEARLMANSRDFDSAWKLARGCYWLGGHVPETEQRRTFENGIETARKAIATDPKAAFAHAILAESLSNQGKYKDASKFYNDAKKGAQDDKRLDLMWPAQRGLGRSLWLQAAQEKDPKKINSLRESALGNYKESLATIETLREVFSNGLIEKSVHDLKRATALLARFNVTADALSAGTGKVKYFEGTPIPTSILIVIVLGVAFSKHAIDDQLWFGAYRVFELAILHPLTLIYAVSGMGMISSTIRIPKP